MDRLRQADYYFRKDSDKTKINTLPNTENPRWRANSSNSSQIASHRSYHAGVGRNGTGTGGVAHGDKRSQRVSTVNIDRSVDSVEGVAVNTRGDREEFTERTRRNYGAIEKKDYRETKRTLTIVKPGWE